MWGFLLGSDFLIMYVNAHECIFEGWSFDWSLEVVKMFVSPLFYVLDFYHHPIRAYIPNICTTICRNITTLRSLCSRVLAKKFNKQLSRKTKCVYMCILIKFIMYRTEFTKKYWNMQYSLNSTWPICSWSIFFNFVL